MTQEEKQLLLKDLSARLPYWVFVNVTESGDSSTNYDCLLSTDILKEVSGKTSNLNYKPYLRPMSSMTDEETKELKHLIAFSGSPDGAANLVDWLNKKMFAYRTIDGKDMFKLGLALEAPEGMYKNF